MFGPEEIKVERSVSIKKPTILVKSILGDFKYFHFEWSTWTEKDSAIKTTYKSNLGEVGHFYSWQGNKEVGSVEMKLFQKQKIVWCNG